MYLDTCDVYRIANLIKCVSVGNTKNYKYKSKYRNKYASFTLN